MLKICKSPTEFHSTIFYVMKCERLMCFILGLNEIINILFRRWFIGSFLYSIENSDFCTKFGPFLDPFPAKSPNLDLKRKFGPLWQQCNHQTNKIIMKIKTFVTLKIAYVHDVPQWERLTITIHLAEVGFYWELSKNG